MLRALTSKAAGSGSNELEYLLQKVLMVLVSMHRRAASGRSPLQLSEAAAVIFDALRVVDACEVCRVFLEEPNLLLPPTILSAWTCSAECLMVIPGYQALSC